MPLKGKRLSLSTHNFTPEEIYTSPYFVLKKALSIHTTSRYGVVVGKEVSGSAVRRNAIRRRVRGWARRRAPDTHNDVLLIARPRARTLDKGSLHEALTHIFRKAGFEI